MPDTRDLEQQLASAFGNTEPRAAGFEARIAAGSQLRIWRKRRRRTLAMTSLGGIVAAVVAWVAVSGRIGLQTSKGEDVVANNSTVDRPLQGAAPPSSAAPQPTAPVSPPSAATGKALVVIETQPTSIVFVDGVVRGDSATPLELESGTYEIRVEREGADSKRWKVTLQPGQWLRLKHDFARVPVAADLPSRDKRSDAVASSITRTIADTDIYELRAILPRYVAKGVTESVRLEALPKPGWAIDTKSPSKLVITSAEDLAVFNPTSTTDDAVAFTKQGVAFKVDFNASSSGDKVLGADLHFGLCSKTKCKTQSVKVSWELSVEESPELGGMVVKSQPAGARVQLDGKFIGSTPLKLGRLPKGAHHLRISKDGYLPHQLTARIKAHESSKVMVKLEKHDEDEFAWLESEPTPPADIPERLGRRDISEGIGKIRGRISICGDKHGSAKGTLKARITIGGSGQVTNVTSTGPNAGIRACVEKEIRRARFPKTQKGQIVTYPFVFR